MNPSNSAQGASRRTTPGHQQQCKRKCRAPRPGARRSPPCARHATRCACSPNQGGVEYAQTNWACLSKRAALALGAASTVLAALQLRADAGGMEKYLKKKRLEPLASYVPAVLVAQSQLLDVPSAAEQFGLEAARALLREGAFVGLRDNVRAIGDYAAASLGKDASKARVQAFFKAIEDLDLLIFQEIRKPDPMVPDNLDELVDKANKSLEQILSIVPEQDLDQGREVVAVLRSASPVLTEEGAVRARDAAPTDAERAAMRQLQGLL